MILRFRVTKFLLSHPKFLRGVAQPGSAPALGAGSRRFKSSRPDQQYQPLKGIFKPFFCGKFKRGTIWGTRSSPLIRDIFSTNTQKKPASIPGNRLSWSMLLYGFSAVRRFSSILSRLLPEFRELAFHNRFLGMCRCSGFRISNPRSSLDPALVQASKVPKF